MNLHNLQCPKHQPKRSIDNLQCSKHQPSKNTQRLDSLLKGADRLRVLRRKLDLLSKDYQRCVTLNLHHLRKDFTPAILNSTIEMLTIYSEVIESIARFQLSNQQGVN